ncbi:hypothetical protein ACOSQ4_021860 [Xanthoceras sorbifolium]
MQQLEGFVSDKHPSYVCQLHKALYGLKQAPRSWFYKLRAALVSWGFQNSVSDVSLFIHHSTCLVVYLLVYVDDILITGNDSSQIQLFIAKLHFTFALKT